MDTNTKVVFTLTSNVINLYFLLLYFAVAKYSQFRLTKNQLQDG
jgi:hypothetical protein